MTSPSMRQLAEFLLDHAKNDSFERGLDSVSSELLVSNRIKMIDNFLGHYFALLEQKGSSSLVSVTTPTALDASSRAAIKSSLQSRLLVKSIDATFEVDPGLVTGFIASNYSRRIESSGRQTLHTLEEI